MERDKIMIGITHGDINGTSYEVMMKAFQETRFSEMCTPVIYGSPKIAGYYRKVLNINNSAFNSIQNIDDAQDRKVNLLNVLDDNAKVELGKPTQMGGEAAMASLTAAIEDLKNGDNDAVVLNPINVKTTSEYGVNSQFNYIKNQLDAPHAVTMLLNSNMRIALLSDSMPMNKVVEHITIDNLVEKLRIVSDCLVSDFGIEKPKIAVLGYNPNCSGVLPRDSEEQTVIIPAIEQANNEGIVAMGPYDADVVFGTDLFKKFDAILAMYYTQGVVPFKAISYDAGMSYLIGVQQICVAPFQSVGYDIAGLDQAQPNAFQNAIYTICDIYNRRQQYQELIANQLQKQVITE